MSLCLLAKWPVGTDIGVTVMQNTNKIDTFQDFWTAYVLDHESRASRACHFGGLVLSVATAAALLSAGMVFFLVLAIVPALIGAWLGHKLSPHHDRSGSERPEWAALADVKMFTLAITGRLGREIDRIHALGAQPSRPSWSNV